MSELEHATELQMYLQLSDLLLRPARLKPALRVSPEPLSHPFGCAELVNCDNAEGPPRQLTEGARFSMSLPGEQPAQIERALQQCASLVQMTAQPSTPDSSRHQARQAALCQMILAEKANLEQMQSVLQSAMIGYTIAVRKGALLQHTLNTIQPRFLALRREKDRAERTAAGLATQVQNLLQSLQAEQGQRAVLDGQMQTLQDEKTVLTGRVGELEGDQGHLRGRVQQLERQNATMEKDAASLQELLDVAYWKQQEEVATRERFQLENKVLQREVADQEQQIATHAQELRAHKQNMQEQGEQQVVKLEQQVDDLLSKLKDEQKGKEAAVKACEEEVQKLQRQHQTESAGQSSQINDLQQCLAEKTKQHDRLAADHSNALEVQTDAVQKLTSQLADSTSVASRLEAELTAKEAQVKRLNGELSAKEAQVQRLDGELSEQQGQVHQLHTLASEKTTEVERLTAQLAEKQGDIEKREGVMRQFASHLRSSQQQVAAEKQEKASAAQAHSLLAQDLEAKIAALGTRLDDEQKDKAAAVKANKAMVQRLKRQLAEQQTKSDVESAARCSEIGGLQQRLASKTQQHDRLAEDYKNGLQAHKSQLQRATAQLTEKQCVVEVKQAEIGKLEDCLIASQQEVAAVHQEHASAVQAHSDAAQEYESKIAALDLGLKKEQQDKADAVKAHKFQLQRATAQLAEKQCVVEVKQAEIGKLGDCLTASQQEVATMHQGTADAAQANSAAAQEHESKIDELDLSLKKEQEDKAAAIKANKSVVQGLQHQLVEKQSLVEDKQVMIDSLGSRLKASVEQVSTVRQELASAQKAHSADTQEYEHRVSLLSDLLLQQDSAAGEQKELIADLTQRLSTTSCEVSGLHQQGGMRMVDDELDAEELHPQLHHSESWAGASSSQRHDSSALSPTHCWGCPAPAHCLRAPGPTHCWGCPAPAHWLLALSPTHCWGCPAPAHCLPALRSSSERGPETPSNGWDSEPSSSAAASEQHDDGMGPPGFPGNPNRSLGMAAAQYMQQYQDGRSVRRGKRAGEVARIGKKGPAKCTATAAGTGWENNEGDPSEWKARN